MYNKLSTELNISYILFIWRILFETSVHCENLSFEIKVWNYKVDENCVVLVCWNVLLLFDLLLVCEILVYLGVDYVRKWWWKTIEIYLGVIIHLSLYLRLPFFSSSSLPKSTLIARSGSEREYNNNQLGQNNFIKP